jgi:hypothetical protein
MTFDWHKLANGFFVGTLIGLTAAVTWAFVTGWPRVY